MRALRLRSATSPMRSPGKAPSSNRQLGSPRMMVQRPGPAPIEERGIVVPLLGWLAGYQTTLECRAEGFCQSL